MDALFRNEPPYKLTEITERFPEFAFLDKCWAADPMTRPSMDTVCKWMGVPDDEEFVITYPQLLRFSSDMKNS